MNVRDLSRVDKWLNQFSEEDQVIAEYVLKKMRYISFQEFENEMQRLIGNILKEISGGRGKQSVALFPVGKSMVNDFNTEKEVKQSADSSGRVGHILKNIERKTGSNVEVLPRIESMKSKRIRHIILVDDLVGTGDRVSSYWVNHVSGSIKSWCSFGWCKVWLVSFAGTEQGLQRVSSKIGVLDKKNIKTYLEISDQFWEHSKDLRKFLERYKSYFGGGGAYSGYGGSMCPIVFQHGCPNNVPLIFWKSGRHNSKKWKPLFPERGVPEDLYQMFDCSDWKDTTDEDLWLVSRYRHALRYLEKGASSNGDYYSMLILTYLYRGWSLKKIKGVLVLAESEINNYVSDLYQSGLLTQDYGVSKFGIELLNRFNKIRYHNKRQSGRNYQYYYPQSFMGFQRGV